MDPDPRRQPSDWHKPGNGSRIKSIGSQIISFLAGALLYSFVLGGKSQRFDDLLVWKGQVDAQMKSMNEAGTWGSQRRLESEAKDIGIFEGRLKTMEAKADSIQTMQYKIEQLEKWRDEQRNPKR